VPLRQEPWDPLAPDCASIELASIGPGPLCAMLLADLGADVVRIDRTEPSGLGVPMDKTRFDINGRNRRSVALDLKSGAAAKPRCA
jgi:alpha-methylacyl-CoA racemase